jgi:hypothetical protein
VVEQILILHHTLHTHMHTHTQNTSICTSVSTCQNFYVYRILNTCVRFIYNQVLIIQSFKMLSVLLIHCDLLYGQRGRVFLSHLIAISHRSKMQQTQWRKIYLWISNPKYVYIYIYTLNLIPHVTSLFYQISVKFL